ncbi:hypothetical protein G4D82_13995 [Flavobacterium sp. CYK-4]|uniref:hypothetical protein n=1 Tax=Flavobacterium lotistagni TaxID=2709660 RepID=UPI00140BAE89|nr:hypothetical protein [Flavobacterium lotistagni]NHM08336.1 hypothetical protein [Flavobacterium lotistagni]
MEIEDVESLRREYKKSREVWLIAEDEKTAKKHRVDIGEKYCIEKNPTNNEEAIEKLEKDIGLIFLEICIAEFDLKYPRSYRAMSDELAELQSFIDKAESYSLVDAFDYRKVTPETRDHYEYLKFVHGFYQKKEFFVWESFFEKGSIPVYSKYVLYKKWLETQISKLEPEFNFDTIGQQPITIRKRVDFFEDYSDRIQTNTQKHPAHNPNLWNPKSYDLFKYLFENYYTGKNTQLMNIWFFLKSDIGVNYLQKPPRKLYLNFVLESYNVKITNFDKPHNWFEKHLPILKQHLRNFEENN